MKVLQGCWKVGDALLQRPEGAVVRRVGEDGPEARLAVLVKGMACRLPAF
ncbi:hypothetical protein [Thermanaeromonas toyohensis]|nr:hypothetical protein [Thermanaeromonas toyohensis]